MARVMSPETPLFFAMATSTRSATTLTAVGMSPAPRPERRHGPSALPCSEIALSTVRRLGDLARRGVGLTASRPPAQSWGVQCGRALALGSGEAMGIMVGAPICSVPEP